MLSSLGQDPTVTEQEVLQEQERLSQAANPG